MRLFAALCFTAALACAADVSGVWSGKTRLSIDGRLEEDTIHFSLKQRAGQVTGTAGPSPKDQAPIRNGKIEGNHLTFDLPVPQGVFQFDLTQDGDHLTGSLVAAAQGQTIKATVEAARAK